MRFEELGLEPSLQSGIKKLNFENCTPIQEACMPTIFDGRDVSGLAQTGTGKTAAFLIPLMDRILKSRVSLENLSDEQKELLKKRSFADWRAQNFILILVPTRELAEQVQENLTRLSVDCGLKGFAIYGGTSYDKQKEAVRNGLDFIVATPGRLIDLYKENIVDLKQVRAVVFDEADRMFDMGFKDDMKFVLGRIPRDRQFLVFSATLNFDVLNTAYQFGAEPVEINVSRDQTKAENVKDELFHVGNEDKPQLLLSLLKKHQPKQAIIFSNFKFSVERLAQFLSGNGIPAMGISSLLTQAQRTRVMEQFRAENESNILVATDVAARGLDIKGVDLVINFELPMDAESYVHRIGRTGRAGAEGKAFSLVSDRDVDSLSRIEEYLKHKVEIGWIDDADMVKDFKQVRHESHSSRTERGPRDFQKKEFQPRRPRPEGGRPQGGGNGPRREARPGDGPRPQSAGAAKGPARGPRQQDRDRGPRKPRAEGEAGASQPARREYRPDLRNKNTNVGGAARKPHTPRPHTAHGARKPQGLRNPPPKSIGQKVAGFFKKLLG